MLRQVFLKCHTNNTQQLRKLALPSGANVAYLLFLSIMAQDPWNVQEKHFFEGNTHTLGTISMALFAQKVPAGWGRVAQCLCETSGTWIFFFATFKTEPSSVEPLCGISGIWNLSNVQHLWSREPFKSKPLCGTLGCLPGIRPLKKPHRSFITNTLSLSSRCGRKLPPHLPKPYRYLNLFLKALLGTLEPSGSFSWNPSL